VNKVSVKNIYKSFGDKEVLKGISFEVKKNQSLAILGGSGAGKSVFIKLVANLIKPDLGEIKIDGKKLDKSIYQKIGFLFQGSALFDSINIWRNVAFSLVHNQKKSLEEARNMAIEQLKSVDLSEDVAEKFPHELSGGMQKRAALARATIINPEVLLLDEPTTGLDPISSDIINDLIIKQKEKIKCSTITITHDLRSAMKISDNIVFIKDGKVEWLGKSEELVDAKSSHIQKYINSCNSTLPISSAKSNI
jgi:phospholipid/cholesterol/gamma-HCH transport system ATP-binding protein